MQTLFDVAKESRTESKFESVSGAHAHAMQASVSVCRGIIDSQQPKPATPMPRFKMSILEIYNNAAYDLLMSKKERSVRNE